MDDVTSTGRRVPALIRPVRNWVRAFPKLAIVGAVTLQLVMLYSTTCGGFDQKDRRFAPIGFLFMMVAVLSFTRGVQRLIEQTWELEPLSVRNTFNGLLWIGGLALYVALSGILHAALEHTRLELAAALLGTPLTAAFLVWSGRVLSAKRIESRKLLPFGLLGAVLIALYSVGATVYVPHLFSSYASRYGVIGAVFAMISALFCVMVVTVVSAAAGREIDDELGRIRRGERPADDEVQRQWDEVTAEARSRWQTLREQIEERRRKRQERRAERHEAG